MYRISDSWTWQDVRQACRLFARHPGLTSVMVLSITCGAGANVTIFSAVDALLLRPLPIPRAGELLTIGGRIDTGIGVSNVASYPDYVDLRTRARSFAGLAAFDSRTAGVRAHPRRSVEVKVISMVSGNFFGVLGVAPQLGRTFAPDEDRVPGRDAVAVLSHGLWQKEFAGDPSVIGRTIQISNVDFAVIGVLPERFTGLEPRYVAPSPVVRFSFGNTWWDDDDDWRWRSHYRPRHRDHDWDRHDRDRDRDSWDRDDRRGSRMRCTDGLCGPFGK